MLTTGRKKQKESEDENDDQEKEEARKLFIQLQSRREALLKELSQINEQESEVAAALGEPAGSVKSELVSETGSLFSMIGSRRRTERPESIARASADDPVQELWQSIQSERERKTEKEAAVYAKSFSTSKGSDDGGEVASPKCPECSSWMVIRTNRTSGQPFWACPGHPHCMGTRPMQAEVNRWLKSASKPKPVKTVLVEPEEDQGSTEAKLKQALYDRQTEMGIFKPGQRSQYDPDRIKEQADCEHKFHNLQWGGNKQAKYATCKRCGQKLHMP